jgi:hypothetical protein
MGADQSTTRNSGESVATAARRTCYYEVLGVDRQAGDDECVWTLVACAATSRTWGHADDGGDRIRKAYRKKALLV